MPRDFVCECVKSCQHLVSANSMEEAAAEASELCEGAPWECSCSPLM